MVEPLLVICGALCADPGVPDIAEFIQTCCVTIRISWRAPSRIRLEVFSVIKDTSGITLQVSRFDFSLPPYTAKIFHMSKLD